MGLICLGEHQKVRFTHCTMLLILVTILTGEAVLPIYIAHGTRVNLTLNNIGTVMDTFGMQVALNDRDVLQDKDKQVFCHIYK